MIDALKLPKFILIWLVFAFSSILIAEDSSITHEIDKTLWVAGQVDWSLENNKVHIYLEDVNERFVCEQLGGIAQEFYSKEKQAVSMGKKCNKLVVLVNYPQLNNVENFKQFVSAHESFHLTVQVFNTPIVIGLNFPEEDGFEYGLEFIKLLNASISNPTQVNKCKSLSLYLDSLPILNRNKILFKAMYEWPAEYYAKNKIFGSDNTKYYEFRAQLTKGLNSKDKWVFNDFYISSIILIERIEELIPRVEWQNRVMRGESIFDIYQELNGCRTYSKNWFKARVSDFKFPYDKSE